MENINAPSKTIPVTNIVDSLIKLRNLPKPEHTWYVWAWVLNLDVNKGIIEIDNNKRIDNNDLYGYTLALGSFKDKESADDFAKLAIERSGYPGVVVGKFGYGVPMRVSYDARICRQVFYSNDEKEKEKLKKIAELLEKKEEDELKERVEKEEREQKELIEEDVVGSLGYVKRNLLLCVEGRNRLKEMEKKIREIRERVEYRMENIREGMKALGENLGGNLGGDECVEDRESKKYLVLNHLKSRLEDKGEMNLFDGYYKDMMELFDEMGL